MNECIDCGRIFADNFGTGMCAHCANAVDEQIDAEEAEAEEGEGI